MEGTSLVINIISSKNGCGLEADQKILGKALANHGHYVRYKTFFDTFNEENSRADINIFFEHIVGNSLQYAKKNWFIPNPEWYGDGLEILQQIDLILCRTKEVERIFNQLNIETYFLGFTSFDCYIPCIFKDYKHFFHLVGGSIQKGTDTVLNVWKKHMDFPLLTILKHENPLFPIPTNIEWISNRMDEPMLRWYQNKCGIHVCISETEGFGHSIMEAMSAGAVVITTNAPPMNEFIQDPNCLVAFDRIGYKALATNYYASPLYLEFIISYLIYTMPPEQLAQIGYNNRQMYLQKTAEFKSNLEQLLLKTCIELKE